MTQESLPTPMMIGFESLEPDWTLLQEVRPAGIILFSRNIASKTQLKDLCSRLNRLDPQPLIAMDLEGGRVNRLLDILGSFPEPARLNDAQSAEKAGAALGAALNAFGICLDLAPVVDLDFGIPDNGLPTRTLGSEPARVAELALHFITGLRQVGVEGCLKHFPGLGTTRGDSHLLLPTLNMSRAAWNGQEGAVYRHLALPELQHVPLMLAHCRVPFWDNQVASHSPKAIAWIRRQGYHGLILTDDLEMKAIPQDRIADVAVESLEAGADLVLICHDHQKIHGVWSALQREGWNATQHCHSLARKIEPLVHRFQAAPAWDLDQVAQIWSDFEDVLPS